MSDAMREAFEKLKLFHAHDYHERNGDDYVNPFVNKAWKAYQAALSSTPAHVVPDVAEILSIGSVACFSLSSFMNGDDAKHWNEEGHKLNNAAKAMLAAAPQPPAQSPAQIRNDALEEAK